MVITTKALELQKDAVITWNWKERDAPAGRELAGNRECLKERQEEEKKLDRRKVSMSKQKNDALESVRKLLEDNQKALKVLDVLDEKNKDYLKTRRYAGMIEAATSVLSLVSIFGGSQLSRNGNVVGVLITIIGLIILMVQFVCSNHFDGIPKTIFGIEPMGLSLCTELDYINDLLSENISNRIIIENLPFVKAANSYFINMPDGLKEVELEDILYDKDSTRMVIKELCHKKLCWDRKGFHLKEIAEIKIFGQ